MPDNDPFAQLDSQLSTNTNVQQQAVQTKPTDNDPFGSLDSQLSNTQNNVANTAAGDYSNKPPSTYENGAVWAGIDSYIRTNQNMVDSVLDLGARIGETFGGGPDLAAYRKELQKSNETMNTYVDEEAKLHPYASAVGTGVGIVQQVIQGLAATGGSGLVGAGSSLLRKAGVGAGEGLVYGGLLNYSPTIQGRIENGVTGGLLGMAAPVAIQGYKASTNTLGGMLKDSTTGLSGTISKILPGTAKNAAVNDVNVVNTTKNSVQTMLDDFVPGGEAATQQKQDELYAGLKNVSLDDASTESLLSNTAINKYLQQMEGQELGLKTKLPNNNVAKLDQLKQNIDKDIYNTTHNINSPSIGGFKQTLTSDQLGDLMQARNLLVDTLTKQGKSLGIDYASIRKLGESKALYTRLSDTLKQAANQKNLDPTFDPTNVVQNKSIGKLYDVLAGTDLKKEYLLNAVESAGGDVNNTKQIISLLNTLRNNPVDTIIANAGKSFDMAKDGLFLGSDKLLGTIVNKFTTGRYNDAVLKLVSSGPKLQENLSKALESGIIGKSLLALNPILNKLSENAGKMVGLQAQGLSPQDNSQQGYLK